MKILVTGGAGFIGSNFILKYISKNIILNYDKLTYAGNLNNLVSIQNHKNYSFVNGDIKNKQTVLEQYPLEKLSSLKKLGAYKHNGFWQCVDTIRDKEILEKAIKKKFY